jgi:hypothetical protein
MKNIIKNTDAVAYLLIVGLGLTIIISGICYNVTSDIVDTALSSISLGYSNMPDATMDADTIEGGNMVLMTFKFCLMPILIIITYFCVNMSTKPLRPW